MPEPASRAELIEAMVAARTEFDSLIELIPRRSMTRPGAAGEWSVKDIVAHVTSYDVWLALTLGLRGLPPPELWIEDIPLDEFNRRLFEENRDKPLDDVLRESEEVWLQILGETKAAPEAYLFTERSVEGVPYRFRPCDILRSESYGHYLDHVPSLRVWLEATEVT